MVNGNKHDNIIIPNNILTPESENLIKCLNNIIEQIKTTPEMASIYEFEISVMLDTMKQDGRFKEFKQTDPRIL